MNSAYFTPPHRIPAGNYFEMAVKLSQLTWGNNTQGSIPFTPEPGDRFQVLLVQHGGKNYRCSNVSINGTTLTFSINGDISIGLYSLEIIVTRADNKRLRSLQKNKIEIVFSNEEAGIPDDDEFQTHTITLGGAILMIVDGAELQWDDTPRIGSGAAVTSDGIAQALNALAESVSKSSSTASSIINLNNLLSTTNTYTLTTAIEALAAYESSTGKTYRKSGLVLTYKTDTDTWESKQFLGEVEDFADETLWDDFGSGGQPAGDYATRTELVEGLATKQNTISDLETIRSGAGKGATSVQGVKMEGDDDPLTPDENGVVTIPQPEIPNAITSVIANNELVFQTPDGQSVKGKVGVTTGADGLLHLTLTDEEGHTYSSPIAGLRVVGNALQYSNDGETWVTVQTFGKLAIKYAQASDPASGDEGDLALVGSTNAYVLKVYVGGSWVSVADFGTLDLTSDGITMAGENKTLTQKIADIDGQLELDALSSDDYTVSSAKTELASQPRKKVSSEFEVGKTYIVEISLANPADIQFTLFLYKVNYTTGGSENNVCVALCTIPVGTTYKKLEYTPEEGKNYQLVGAWMSAANTVGSVHITYREKAKLANIANDIEDIKQEMFDGLYKEISIDLSQFATKNGSLTTSNSWWTSNGAKHKSILLSAIGVVAGDRLHIQSVYASHPEWNGGFIGWLKAAEATTTYKYVDGLGRIRSKDEVLIVPEGAMYLCLTVVDGDGNSLNNYVGKYASINEVIERDEVPTSGSSNLVTSGGVYDALENKIGKYDVLQSYKIADLPVRICGIGESGKWYTEGAKGRHTYIEVTPGHKYLIKGSFWTNGWVTSDYSITTAPTNNTNVPFVNGTSLFAVTDGQVITAPEGASYLILTLVDGNGSQSSVTEVDDINLADSYEYRLENVESKLDSLSSAKIRYAHWNVGHFTYYDKNSGGSTPNISEANSPAMQLRYKKMLNKVHADIIGICEYDPDFDAVDTPTKSTIFGNYKYQYDGTKYGYQCNSIFSQIVAKSAQSVTFASKPSSGNSHTYYRHCVIVIGGVEVHVVETHLNWETNESTGKRYAFEQMDELISAFGAYSHVIISGDFNFNDIDEYQPFVDDGYTLVNGSYLELDTFLLYLADGRGLGAHLDNIIVKGFAVSNIKVWDESGYYSGMFAKYIYFVQAGDSAGQIEVNGTVIQLTQQESANAATVASKIVSAVTIDGCTLTANGNKIIVEYDTVGENSSPFVYVDGDSNSQNKTKVVLDKVLIDKGMDMGLSDHSMISCDLTLIP